jgi:fibroblast growth factor receptor 2
VDEENPEILKLYNVSYADAGWYTCVAANSLGSTPSTAYLNVVDKLDPEIVTAPMHQNTVYNYLVISLTFFFVIALIIMALVWKKYTKTKKLQRQMERVNQWTKKVIVVQPCIENASPGLSDSLVRICRLTFNYFL